MCACDLTVIYLLLKKIKVRFIFTLSLKKIFFYFHPPSHLLIGLNINNYKKKT